ncbi:YcxB family protein [Kitasatospora sp. NPDC127067]|uniref:YcxB family protein n=1 Tax=Kitasatospora sp. NPDC127067 TaxID=3347126 RepID=UPI003664E442
MGSDGRAVTSVEVRYTPTAADFREAFAAWDRHTVVGRRSRRAVYTVAVGGTAVAGLLAVLGGTVLLLAALLVVVVLLVVLAGPGTRVRRVARAAEDKGEFRVLLDDDGVVVSTEASVTEFAWPEQRYYLETPRLFLLLSGNEEAGVLTMLPKRGADDLRGLGELIDRHATALVPD